MNRSALRRKGSRMRAKSMRRLIGAAAALTLVGATLISSGTALATVPQGTATNEALPPIVTAGDVVGFRANLFYTDTSTLSKAFLTIFTDGTGTNRYLRATRNGLEVANACKIGSVVAGMVSCTFKTVRTNDHLAVTVAFDLLTSPATADGVWSSSGSPMSDTGGTSHGDTWQDVTCPGAPDVNCPATATLGTSGGDYAGFFSILDGSTVANGQTVSSGNIQATKLVGIPAGVAATVLDGDGATGTCTTTDTVDCTKLFGQWSDVTVGDGQLFDTVFSIVITFYAGTPKGFVHVYTDADGPQQEFIGACPKKNPIDSAPCFTWSSKDKAATIYTKHNGGVKGIG
jgi:hypothetical protein